MFNGTILGRLGKDPETKYLASTTLVSFSVAVDQFKNGQKETLWVKVKVFGKRGEAIAKFVRKGDQICVTGQVEMEEWNDKVSGEKRSALVLVGSDFSFVGKASDAARSDTPVHADDIF
jgi:single-strand DNA-binding protein